MPKLVDSNLINQTNMIDNYTENKITDTDVIHRILTGDTELYEILLRRNNQKLYRVIRGYLNEKQEIEDVMQNTYLKAYENLSKFKQSAKFSTWLIRIGINESLARIKAKSKFSTIDNQLDDIAAYTNIQMHNQDQPNPENRIIRHEARQFIEDAIDTLTAKFKSIYIMKEIEGMSISDISEAMDLTQSNVKVRLHRAKALLKEELYELSLHNDIYEFGFSRCDKITERVMSALLI